MAMVERLSPTIKMKKGKIDLKKIKEEAKKGDYLYVLFDTPRGECLIIPSKFSESWWKKATEDDVHRVKVC